MKTGSKIGIAFAITVVVMIVLALVVRDRPDILGIPGTIFLVYTVYTVYRHNANKAGGHNH